jgi:iron complex transport system substrate-binding protein
MKRKDKVITILGISVLMCSLFLVTIPVTAIAAEEDDYVLGVYGNANEDDTIDMRDLTYVKLIFFGKKPETELADAKYDGKINPLDFIQIKLIIVGKEKEITIVDGCDRIVTVKKPIERIAGLHTSPCREFCMLEVEDKVVGVCIKYVKKDLDKYPRLKGKPDIGTIYEPNYETIAEVKPDVLIMSASLTYLEPVVKKLEPMGIKVVGLHLNPQGSTSHERELYYDHQLTQLGYMLDKEERAASFIEWKQGIFDLIEDRTGDLKEEEKVRVFGTNVKHALKGEKEFGCGGMYSRVIGLSGCIAVEPPGSTKVVKVSGEWLLKQDPDVIVSSSYYPKEGFGYSVTDETLAKQTLDQVLDHVVIRETKAAKEGKISLYSYYGLSSGGQTPLGALYLAKRVYPERFEDVDPAEYHRHYFEDWFNVGCQGVWFYP